MDDSTELASIVQATASAEESRPHIGIILPAIAEGGAEKATLSLAGALFDRGYGVDLILLRPLGLYRATIPEGISVYYLHRRKYDDSLIDYFRERGIGSRKLSVGLFATWRTWLAFRRRYPGCGLRRSHARAALAIARYIREAGGHLLYSVLSEANDASVLAGELTGYRVPVVVSIRNNVSMSAGYDGSGLAAAQALTPKADAVVAVSNGVAADAVQTLGLDAQRVHTIYNAKPLEEIRRLAGEPVTHPWFRSSETPVILSVLKDAPQKDWATLVKAFGKVRQNIPARLAILGRVSDAYIDRATAFAASLGVKKDVEFLGFDENPFRYMGRAHLFVHSSRHEGLPNVLIEALACGTPVVSTDSPYGPDEILESGRWGRLTPVGDAETMAQAILQSLNGDTVPAEALRRRAEEFSTERSVAAYGALFARTIRRNADKATADRI